MSHRLLALDLTGRRVVVVGGGAVGARRALDLADHGAQVHVVSPTLHPRLVGLVAADVITWVQRPYAGRVDLDGAWLVHVATGDDRVDAIVAHDADDARVWCVRAGDAASSPVHVVTVTTVATDDGPVTVGVHAGGRPRLAVAVRDRVQRALGARAHRALRGIRAGGR